MRPVAGIFESGNDRYQRDMKFTHNDDPYYDLNRRRLAAMVGLAAMGLPVVLFVGTFLGTCFYTSISHFYYAQFLGGVFIATLVFIAMFMVTYSAESKRESNLATIAGVCALGVALIPTEGRGCHDMDFAGRALLDFTLKDKGSYVTVPLAGKDYSYFEIFPNAGNLHLACATLVFVFLAYHSFRVFTRVIDSEHKSDDGVKLTEQKRRRNKIYHITGWIIVSCMAIMFANFAYEKLVFKGTWWDENHMTFWLEGLSLMAFGFAWMVKGRFFNLATGLMDKRDFRFSS